MVLGAGGTDLWSKLGFLEADVCKTQERPFLLHRAHGGSSLGISHLIYILISMSSSLKTSHESDCVSYLLPATGCTSCHHLSGLRAILNRARAVDRPETLGSVAPFALQ